MLSEFVFDSSNVTNGSAVSRAIPLRRLGIFLIAGWGLVSMAFAETKPFRGVPGLIPGLIEAEHFDEGPAGEAYSDVEEKNLGVDLRPGVHVDIEQRPDASNGHGVGWTRTGEWLAYTVHVARTGRYDVEIPVASNKLGGIFHLEFSGRDVSGPIQVPDTGSWQQLKTIYVTGLMLDEGKHTMKVVLDKAGPSGSIGDIDYLHFVDVRTDDNTLSAVEQKAGWRLLFNGSDHAGWQCNNGKPIAAPIEEGALVPFKSGGYLIVHEEQFSDFVLRCDVRWENAKCNSGVFFRVADPTNPVHTGFEVQVMSGSGTGKHDMGAIYDLAAPSKNVTKPTGEWNRLEIECRGARLAVRVNGVEVTTMNCDDFGRAGYCPDGERHKFKLNKEPRAIKEFQRSGYLGFQDHGNKVWYKNIKILPLGS